MGLFYYWVYILYCDNGSYYTGYTNDLPKRYKAHLSGTGKCRYTRSFKPKGIAQAWQIHGEKAFAMQIERYIKKLTREEKRAFILNPRQLLEEFYPDTRIIWQKLVLEDV